MQRNCNQKPEPINNMTTLTKKEMEQIILGLKMNISRAVDDLNDVKAYLLSAKFHKDTTVQVADVLRRLEEVRLRDDERFREWLSIGRKTK